ncbi:hypothetical protein BDP27DRAFT_633783 [Rhodocollybia butyracea]|uniref:Uncharacterized protein n=1 Tax=Rhodocollybia butyracea TaxID=206335 RepID=A0A9P5TWW2_9AGAR|nr:hypothetical protein BDP27DRAFT_633783 [Rhodocollybia butyracea]
MTPEEQQLISLYAGEALRVSVPLILTFAGYGGFVLGFIIAVRSLTIRESWGRPQIILLVCLVTILVCFTWEGLYNGAVFLTSDRYTFAQTSEQGLAAQAQAALKKVKIWEFMSDWPATINNLLSDGIVVWRAWCLSQQDRYWRLTLALLMIANIGVNVADCIWGDLGMALSSPAILDWILSAISLIVNMVATILFACKAWAYHQYIAGLNSSSARNGTWAENILHLLIESGVVFCAVQSIYIVIAVLGAYNIITSLWPLDTIIAINEIAAACYPVAVIALVPRIQTNNISILHGQSRALTA